MRTCIFPGTFDPITIGHIDIINRALNTFDKVIIAILDNKEKKTMFSLQKRLDFIASCFVNNIRVEITSFDGLLVNFCRQKNCRTVVRGVRDAVDYAYESNMFAINRHLDAEFDTLFIPTNPKLSYVSSKFVRELISFNEKYDGLVACTVAELIKGKT